MKSAGIILLALLLSGMAILTWNSFALRRAAEQEREKAALACGRLYWELEKRSARYGEPPPPHPAHCTWVN